MQGRELARLIPHGVVRLFGDLVKDVPPNRPKAHTDEGLIVGSESQRKYARKFRKATMKEDSRHRAVQAFSVRP